VRPNYWHTFWTESELFVLLFLVALAPLRLSAIVMWRQYKVVYLSSLAELCVWLSRA